MSLAFVNAVTQSFNSIVDPSVVSSLASAAEEAASGHGDFAMTFLWIAVILLAAKFSGLIERLGQPTVLGELLIGVVLGNLVLLGITVFEPMKQDNILVFLAELGVVILLFQIGLESNVKQMMNVGARAFAVAVIGVAAPFALGTFVIGPLLMPEAAFNTHLFIGAAMTATSVGITAAVFRGLGTLQSKEAQIVLGAAVIDDVLGLIILAVVSAVVAVGVVGMGTIGIIIVKAVVFLLAAIVVGQLAAPYLGQFLSRISPGTGMKFTLAIAFALIFAYLAQLAGLAPIVGAFAAGLVLDAVHFRSFREPEVVTEIKACVADAEGGTACIRERVHEVAERHTKKHVEDLIEPVAYFLVPVFFVMTGMQFKIETLFDMNVLLIALAFTVVAIIGKVLSGLAAGKVNKLIVGVGMVPRGEVGLVFASIGMGLGVVTDEVYSVIIIFVFLTTLLTPPVLSALIKKSKPAEEAPAIS